MKSLKKLLALAIIIMLFNSGFSQNKTDRVVEYKNIPGVNKDLLSLNIYNSGRETSLRPIIIWVHGGGWVIGDKDNLGYKNLLMQKLGYILISVNYRLSPSTAKEKNTVSHPDHVNDVADAVAWVYKNSADFGGDKNKIVIIGHSAGAQIAALLATNDRFLTDRGLSLNILKGCASLDTEHYNIPELIKADGGKPAIMTSNAFGTNVDGWIDASPSLQIAPGKNIPSFLLVERGSYARKKQVYDLRDKLKLAGVKTTVVNLSSLSHSDVSRNIGATADKTITPALTSFLAECFK